MELTYGAVRARLAGDDQRVLSDGKGFVGLVDACVRDREPCQAQSEIATEV
jgi:hypothetical protein